MIYSNRLRLRAAEREDLPRFVRWLNDPEVIRNLSLTHPLSQASEEKWFQANLERHPAEQVLVIEVKTADDWKPIGNISLMDIHWVDRNAEIGIFIGEKDEWNKGYGRGAMKLMLRHGFNELNLQRIFLRVLGDNLRGIKAYEYAGFKQEGVMRQAVYRNGKYIDLLLMSVLRTEWQDGDF
jgi:RimJ/RimL family protein N-acetyltransferase